MLPRILIVDDDPACLLALSEALQWRFPCGAAVDTALSADEGLRLAGEREYDALICDVRLPGKDGVVFLKQSRERRPDVPVVLMTAGGLEQEEEALYGGPTLSWRSRSGSNVFGVDPPGRDAGARAASPRRHGATSRPTAGVEEPPLVGVIPPGLSIVVLPLAFPCAAVRQPPSCSSDSVPWPPWLGY